MHILQVKGFALPWIMELNVTMNRSKLFTPGDYCLMSADSKLFKNRATQTTILGGMDKLVCPCFFVSAPLRANQRYPKNWMRKCEVIFAQALSVNILLNS